MKAVLDRHGYGFQYAVLKKCKDLYDHYQDSPWAPEVAELPVEIEQGATHLDFVLRTGNALLVAECKRVDPALAYWGFVRAPFTRATSLKYDVRRPKVDRISIDSAMWKTFATAGTISGGEPFHIGKEIRPTGRAIERVAGGALSIRRLLRSRDLHDRHDRHQRCRSRVVESGQREGAQDVGEYSPMDVVRPQRTVVHEIEGPDTRRRA